MNSTTTDPNLTPPPAAPVAAAVAAAPKAAPRRAARKTPPAAQPAAASPAVASKKVSKKVSKPTPVKAGKATAVAVPKAPALPAVPAKGVVVAAPSKGDLAAAKVPKIKARLVRDSFTMPQADYDLIGQLKSRALGFQRPAKKSELLRAGLQALAALDDAALRSGLDGLVPLKSGRPKKSD